MMFKTLVNSIALSTTSIFNYNPTDDVVRSTYIKDNNLNEDDVGATADKQSERVKTELKAFKE